MIKCLPKYKMENGMKYVITEDNTYLAMTQVDEQNGLTYTLDEETMTYLPNLEMEDIPQTMPTGKYSSLREEYLKNFQQERYTQMLKSGNLYAHLESVQERTKQQINEIVENWKATDKEYLQAIAENNYLMSVGLLNNFIKSAEEIVLRQIVYK